jgi:phosphonoacetaldehyde hydrolase
MNDFRFERLYRGKLQGVILDWAGTTVDYGCMAPAAVFVEVFERQGVPITMEEAREPMGMHKKDHIRIVSKLSAVAKRWQERHGKPCAELDVEAMFDDFIPRQLACIANHADLIPGTLQAVAAFRKRGLKIGTSTGYNREMMNILTSEAKSRGYEPDCVVCASEVPQGRPSPWMVFENAKQLGIYPMEAIVKIGDTVSDIAEGLNAGTWTIGVAVAGNEMGLPEREVAKLNDAERISRTERAYERLLTGGAHFVVDSIADVEPCLDEIECRLKNGERP